MKKKTQRYFINQLKRWRDQRKFLLSLGFGMIYFMMLSFIFLGCSQKKQKFKDEELSNNKVLVRKKKKTIVSKDGRAVVLRKKSPLKDLPIVLTIPSNFRVNFFEDYRTFLYSTAVLIEKNVAKGIYPSNISVNYYRKKSRINIDEVLIIDKKKRDALNQVGDLGEKKITCNGQIHQVHFFTHQLLFPPFKKKYSFVVVREAWLYLEHKGILYELRLKSRVKDFLKNEKIFYQFLESLSFF